MRLMFDAVELTPDSGKSLGIYRYAMGLVTEMARQLSVGDQLLLVCNGDNEKDFAEAAGLGGVTLMRIVPNMPGHLWRQAWMRGVCALWARQHGVDAYLSPKGFVPRRLLWPGRVPRVTVVHDLIPFWYFRRKPGYFGRLETWLVSSAFRNTFAQAEHVVAISAQTHRDLLDEGMEAGRVSVVLNGVDEQGGATAARQDLPAALGGRPFIFAMASRLPHKNLDGVLRAYEAYRGLAGDQALPLALCGASDVTQPGVVALGRVSETELQALYAHADLFLFLSLTEGFGYPPMEALRTGTPVVCSDIGVLEEVAGALAKYVHPERPQDAARAMKKVLSEGLTSQQRAALKQAAQARIASHLSWSGCAEGVWRVIRHEVARGQQPMGVRA